MRVIIGLLGVPSCRCLSGSFRFLVVMSIVIEEGDMGAPEPGARVAVITQARLSLNAAGSTSQG